MDQAYTSFNAGKYKEALNTLTTNPNNIDSYQPNLIICEYLSNRCQPSSLNCLRKLNDLLARKFKRDQAIDLQTQSIVKLNLVVLLVLQGRRDSAILLLEEVYRHRECFVEFMQSRIYLLLLELHNFAKNSVEALSINRYYLLRPTDQRANSQQWASVMFHEHGKTFTVAREEFYLLNRVQMNQALMQLGAPSSSLSNLELDDKLREDLLARARRRKNVLNKYYQINLVLLGRFHEALRALYCREYQKCLHLMNFTTLAEEFQQMPTTKIITNVISAFVNNNDALVHFQLNRPIVALNYLNKAKALLIKACTGVEDRQLHLFSLNYGSYIESISYNQALTLLKGHPKQSFSYFESIRKSGQMSRSYKFWYRMAQSILQYYHTPKVQSEHKQTLLSTALSALNNALYCLDRFNIPSSQQLINLTKSTSLQEDDIEAIIMKMKSEALQFRHSTLTLICYASLGLRLWRKVVRVGQGLLEDKKLDQRNRINVLHYVFEAQSQMEKNSLILRQYLDSLQCELTRQPIPTQVVYTKGQNVESSDYQTLFYHQLMHLHIWDANTSEAYKCCEYIRQKHQGGMTESLRDAVTAMHIKYRFDQKFMRPYLHTPDQ